MPEQSCCPTHSCTMRLSPSRRAAQTHTTGACPLPLLNGVSSAASSGMAPASSAAAKHRSCSGLAWVHSSLEPLGGATGEEGSSGGGGGGNGDGSLGSASIEAPHARRNGAVRTAGKPGSCGMRGPSVVHKLRTSSLRRMPALKCSSTLMTLWPASSLRASRK
eukprot:scaffold128378_cov63-Phaeocystis_antarctica.AAC.4